jgi:uncharacterized membrane protein YgcG
MLSRFRAVWGGAILGLLLSVVAFAAHALTFPELTGRVVDDAGILDPSTKAWLERKLAEFETKTTGQLVVVTLKSLQGTSIEDYGYQLGRHWQIGQKGKNTGALLIVAPNERKVRIEVGYGFEGTLTDAVSKLIIENSIIPRLRVMISRAASVAEWMTSSRQCQLILRIGRRAPPNSGRTTSRASSMSSRFCSFCSFSS